MIRDIFFAVLVMLGLVVGPVYILFGIKKRKSDAVRLHFSDFFRNRAFESSSGQQLIGEGILVIVGAIGVLIAYFIL